MRRFWALMLAFGAWPLGGCTLQATQQFTNRQPGRAPRTTELAMDFRPGGAFVGGELVMEAAPEGFGARGAHARAGYAIEPTPGSGEVWSVDVGGTMGVGRPPFSPDERAMYEAGVLGDLALRIAGPAQEPGVMQLTRFNLSLVVGGRARMWPAADETLGEISAGAGLRGTFDSDGRAILQKVTKETADAFGL